MAELDDFVFVAAGNFLAGAAWPVSENQVAVFGPSRCNFTIVCAGTGNEADNLHARPGFRWIVYRFGHGNILFTERGQSQKGFTPATVSSLWQKLNRMPRVSFTCYN
jgi:hypothetical protein